MAPPRLARPTAARNSPNWRLPKHPRDQFKRRATDLIRKIADKDRYGIFLEPVDVRQVLGYAEAITRPMDLSTLQQNLHAGVYRTPVELHADLDLVWSNCFTFNNDDSVFFREAVRLRALAARYYDELVRLLVRDGVAGALGLASAAARPHTPANARLALTRPPRPPAHITPTAATAAAAASAPAPASAAAAASTSAPVLASASASATPTATATATASPAASTAFAGSGPASPAASLNPLTDNPLRYNNEGAIAAPTNSAMPTPYIAMRRSQLRRAQANHDAALEAVRIAQAEVAQTSRKAGLHPSPCPDIPADGPKHTPQPQLFSGPHGILKSSDVATERTLHHLAAHFPLIKNSRLKPRCEKVPKEWHRIGRWHGPGATHTPFLSTNRARDVHYGRQYAHFVQSSAPIARRLLASVLDAEEVHTQDTALLSMHARTNGTPPEINMSNNGTHAAIAPAEDNVDSRAVASRKRPRSKTVEGQLSTAKAPGLLLEESDTGKLLVEILGLERVRKAAKKGGQSFVLPTASPNKQAIGRVRSLLKSKGIDPSFVSSLTLDDTTSKNRAAANGDMSVGGDGNDDGRMHLAKLKKLLNANYEGIMNTLRLRALRDSVNEAEREEVEDRERLCSEIVAKGVALAAKQLPPRDLVHPMDAAECALAMVEDLQDTHQPNAS